jgi:FkbM family methyltransferase
MAYPQATIVCVEPDAENFNQLKKNTAPYKNIKAIQAGVWNTATSLSIANPSAASWSFELREAEGSSLGVEGVTIDMIREKFDFATIDMAKIDVEGSEKELFESGYESWLPRTKFLIIEVHDWKRKGSSKAVFSAIVHYNFSFAKKGENLIFINEDISAKE